MKLAILLLAAAAANGPLALKEKARVEGRYVKLADVVDGALPDGLPEVYLGPAPAEGETRTITAEEIRRELEFRGIDPASARLAGGQVVVEKAGAAAPAEALLRAVAAAIRDHVAGQEEGVSPGEVSVRIVRADPIPDGELVKVRPLYAPAFGIADFTAVFRDESGTEREVAVVASVQRRRNAVVAARAIGPGTTLRREDLEVRPVEGTPDGASPDDLESLVGASARVRIVRGAPVSLGDVRMKPVIRRGEVVRADGANFQVDAKALEAGAVGEEIGLEFTGTKTRLRGRVTGPGRVEVVE